MKNESAPRPINVLIIKVRRLALKQLFCSLSIKFFLREIIIKSLIETSIVVLTFAAWFPIESAASGFKGEQRP